jgi:hypothetical protein
VNQNKIIIILTLKISHKEKIRKIVQLLNKKKLIREALTNNFQNNLKTKQFRWLTRENQ